MLFLSALQDFVSSYPDGDGAFIAILAKLARGQKDHIPFHNILSPIFQLPEKKK